ncbi:MAG TPA: LysM domain-containing protein, partial [Candidatus Bathyarchaeia archaeon]|nr:LysM domain-containing protein [Candidatus Bathyarchaeia archaeon]
QAPPDTAYDLKVPIGTGASVLAAVELDMAPRKAPPAPRTGVHVVRSGDTVWRIARQYGITAKQVAQWNGLERPDRIFPGERLRITSVALAS